ncbi:hypothetical protein Ciccas_007923 [Cichlidogyrus casuarinus]|uniref:Endonuclease/exonuclease/phosphatase domain-containing protein n=1 Tax=Cichlidogyrus casuarinus TaxID=1844966 RepID=A0ABD2Q1R0_9PLAT
MDCEAAPLTDQEARALVRAFCSRVSDSNEAEAMMFLQMNKWDLEAAVQARQPKNGSLSVLSWNIEGINAWNLQPRITNICDLLLKYSTTIRIYAFHRWMPHIVCLQEVVDSIYTTLNTRLSSSFHLFRPDSKQPDDYFNCILTGVLHLRVYSTHLESCREFAKVREAQLGQLWKKMGNDLKDGMCAGRHGANILCGDLNIRDSEIASIGGVPGEFCDVWQVCGARPEAKFTWDPRRNINCSKLVGERAAPMRFDRMYLGGQGLTCHNFELTGIEKVPNTQCHPSDHWAMLAHFLI